jgi:hypothetical protein
MATTFSSLLRVELIGTGDQSGTWGDTTNRNLGTILEDAIAGTANLNVTLGNVTLSSIDGQPDQARCMILNVTGTPGTTRSIIAPKTSKVYVVVNGSNAPVVLRGSDTTGLTVWPGTRVTAAYTGSDFTFVGINNVPISGSEKTTGYTLTRADIGNVVTIGTGGSITVPDGVFSPGDAVAIFNNTASTAAILTPITTAYIAGTNSNLSSMGLATRGLASVLFISGTLCVVSGNVS